MAVFGWFVFTALIVVLSLIYIFFCLPELGKYKKDGSVRSLSSRLFTFVGGFGYIVSWIKVFQWAPFIVVLV